MSEADFLKRISELENQNFFDIKKKKTIFVTSKK